MLHHQIYITPIPDGLAIPVFAVRSIPDPLSCRAVPGETFDTRKTGFVEPLPRLRPAIAVPGRCGSPVYVPDGAPCSCSGEPSLNPRNNMTVVSSRNLDLIPDTAFTGQSPLTARLSLSAGWCAGLREMFDGGDFEGFQNCSCKKRTFALLLPLLMRVLYARRS